MSETKLIITESSHLYMQDQELWLSWTGHAIDASASEPLSDNNRVGGRYNVSFLIKEIVAAAVQKALAENRK